MKLHLAPKTEAEYLALPWSWITPVKMFLSSVRAPQSCSERASGAALMETRERECVLGVTPHRTTQYTFYMKTNSV